MELMVKYPIVGYGSLLSHDSLKETIKDKKFRKILVKGYKRIFNLVDGRGDVLNLEKCKGCEFNAVLFYVDDEELRMLKLREDEYNLESVDVFDFGTRKKICAAYTSIDHIVDIDSGKMLPQKGYFVLCRKAACDLGEDFGKVWDETTYLSSGERVCDWVKKHKEYDFSCSVGE